MSIIPKDMKNWDETKFRAQINENILFSLIDGKLKKTTMRSMGLIT
jgi:hypothetical protein